VEERIAATDMTGEKVNEALKTLAFYTPVGAILPESDPKTSKTALRIDVRLRLFDGI